MSLTNDIKTRGIVLRRTNYGEADRILNLITPIGKISAIAKGARKEKSKLAGGVEMFSVSDYNIHVGRGELGIVTSVRMVRHFTGILKSLEKTELAAKMMKKIAIVAEGSDTEEFFDIIEQGLSGLDGGMDNDLVEAWFYIRTARACGEEMNLYRDLDGEKLSADNRYDWDIPNAAFFRKSSGGYGANEIKLMRLMTTNKLEVVERVRTESEMLLRVLELARIVGKV